jgi:hypothetical protein
MESWLFITESTTARHLDSPEPGKPSQILTLYFFIKRWLSQQLQLYNIEWKDDNWKINCKAFGKKRSWTNLMYYANIYLEGLRKKIVRIAGFQADIWTPHLPKYEAWVLTTWPWRSVISTFI